MKETFAEGFDCWEKVVKCVEARKISQKVSTTKLPKGFKPDYGYHIVSVTVNLHLLKQTTK